MTIEEAVIQTLHALPPEKQQEVLDFAQTLAKPEPAAVDGGSSRPFDPADPSTWPKPTPEQLRAQEKYMRASGKKPPFTSSRGIGADLGVSISAEEIDEARREMWKNFPRDID